MLFLCKKKNSKTNDKKIRNFEIFSARDPRNKITILFPLTAPPYFAEGKKIFGIFSSKRPFFFYRKKEGGLTAPSPLIFSKFWSEVGGS